MNQLKDLPEFKRLWRRLETLKKEYDKQALLNSKAKPLTLKHLPPLLARSGKPTLTLP